MHAEAYNQHALLGSRVRQDNQKISVNLRSRGLYSRSVVVYIAHDNSWNGRTINTKATTATRRNSDYRLCCRREGISEPVDNLVRALDVFKPPQAPNKHAVRIRGCQIQTVLGAETRQLQVVKARQTPNIPAKSLEG